MRIVFIAAFLLSLVACWVASWVFVKVWVGYIAAALVFVGVAGEAIVELVMWPRNDEKRHRLAVVATLILIGGLAGDLSGIWITDQIIAGLEEKLAPMSLNQEQQETLKTKMEVFAGQPFNIITYLDDKGAVELTAAIDHALLAAGWVGAPVNEWLGLSLIEGVVIEIAPSRAGEFIVAARALAAALNELHIPTRVEVDPGQETHPNAIQLRVGKKS